MESVYVIMKEWQIPTAIAPQLPHEVQPTLKAAKRRVTELNEKSTKNFYWYEKVPMRTGI